MPLIFARLIPTLTLSLTFCFFIGCSGNSGKTAAKVADEKAAVTTPPPGETETAEVMPDTTEAAPPATPEEAAPEETTEVSPKPATPANSSGGLATRTASDNKLTTALEIIARNLEAKNLAYVSSLGQDCSGIFHQIKDSVQVHIPAMADHSKYIYPTFRDDRSSRQVADWYYRHNNLLIVQDAMAERNMIRPGSVMFYGRTDEKYTNLNIELLTNPGNFNHDGTKGKIMHVAVVTSVEKDDAGNVMKYTIMHGRNSKYNASRSSGNYDGPGYDKTFAKFPFGNWNQQWVAMAYIETPK